MPKPVVRREEVLILLREHMPVLRERFGVADLTLFGSTARDEADSDSDVDILVTFDRQPETSWGCYAAQSYLADLFGRQVDMVERQQMRKEYLPWVEADEIDPMNPRLHMPNGPRPKRWDVYVESMLEHCQYVVDYTSGLDFDQYVGDHMRRLAVERSFGIVGEAANKVPESIRDAHPEIDWNRTIGLRHRLVHAYYQINHVWLWNIIQRHVPELAKRLVPLLAEAQAEARESEQ